MHQRDRAVPPKYHGCNPPPPPIRRGGVAAGVSDGSGSGPEAGERGAAGPLRPARPAAAQPARPAARPGQGPRARPAAAVRARVRACVQVYRPRMRFPRMPRGCEKRKRMCWRVGRERERERDELGRQTDRLCARVCACMDACSRAAQERGARPPIAVVAHRRAARALTRMRTDAGRTRGVGKRGGSGAGRRRGRACVRWDHDGSYAPRGVWRPPMACQSRAAIRSVAR